MDIQFSDQELTVYEMQLLKDCEATGDLLKGLDFNSRRALTPPDPVALLSLPVSEYNRLYKQAGEVALASTRKAYEIAQQQDDLLFFNTYDLIG